MFRTIESAIKRSFSTTPLVLLGALSLVLLGQSNVSAASTYDDVFWRQTVVWLPVYDSNTSAYSYRDVGSNWDSLIPHGPAKSSFEDARDNGGHWMVVNGNDSLSIIWSTDVSVKTSFFTKYGQPSWGISSGNQWNVIRLYEQSGVVNQSYFLNQAVDNAVLFGDKPNPLPTSPGGVVFSTYENTYPNGYEGQLIVGPDDDIDGDGLNAADEYSQGSSNFKVDTDGDGLSDYIESQWNPDRDDIFCGISCAYPNPTAKDLYVEIDWMKNGNRTIKPSAAQLSAVTTSFANQGIAAHFDTGQYGGGNELPVYTNELYFEPDVNNLDFFDLKNGNSTYTANFNPDRNYIWHYMISGYKAKYWDTDNNQWITNSSGVAYGGDDDILIATGHIEDDQASFNYNDLDTALSGTIIHEIGHSICLTQNVYTGQSTGCQFNKIDTWASQSYDSVMNYTHQMFQVDYSNGVNGSPDDHDDWTAVLNGGLKDFTDANHNSGDSAGVQSFTKTKKEKVVRGITSSEAKALKKAGKLGGKYKNHNN